MARNVFFSFDYDDIMGVNVIRNSDVVLPENRNLPFRDKSLYEKAKNTPGAIKKAIDDALIETSVTAILNGGRTAYSDWVRYEIAKSFERGNGLFVIDIAGVGPQPVAKAGPNPLSVVGGAPHEDNAGTIDIFEHNGSKWIPFSMLKTVSNADAKYPKSIIEGGGYRFEQRFTTSLSWETAKTNFSRHIEDAAQAAGWPPST